jgi:predicted RNase H-like HicB family nuclease
MRFPVVIHKDADSDYGVTVPDLPGCFSAGDTIDDALTNAVEAIECHIEGLLLDGETVPHAVAIEHHRSKQKKGSAKKGVRREWHVVKASSRLASDK